MFLQSFKSNSYSTSKGLTLIEMLIAMSLLASIMAMIGNTFFQTDKFSKEMENRIQIRKKIRNLKNLLSKDFTSSIYLENLTKPRIGKPTTQSGIVGVKGQTKDIRHDQVFMHTNSSSLFRNNLDLFEDPEIHEVGYFMRLNSDGISYTLYRREDFYVDDKFDFPEQNPIKEEFLDSSKSITNALVDDLLFFEVQYLPEVKTAKDNWLDDWNSASRSRGSFIPYTVKVKIMLPVIDIDELRNNLTINEQGDLFDATKSDLVVTEEYQINLRWPLSSGITWKF